MYVVLLAPLIFFISFWLFRCASGMMSLSRLNLITVVFYYNLLIQSFFGALLISSGIAENSVIDKVSENTKIFGTYWVFYVMIALPIGINISRFCFSSGKIKDKISSFFSSDMKYTFSNKDSYIRIGLYFLTIISFLSAIYVTAVNGSIPQIAYFKNLSHGDLLAIRVSISLDFSGIIYIKTILFEKLPSLLMLISYAYYLKTKSQKDRLWFLLLLLLSIYSATFLLSKGPIVGLFINLLLVRIAVMGSISVKGIFYSIIVVFSLLIIMFKLVTNYSIDKVMLYLLNRLFVDQISGAYLMFDLFPDKIAYIGFRSISSVISPLFFGSYSVPATRLAMEHAYPVAVNLGQMNLLSTLFIGEAWANYGILGAIFSPIYVGFVIGFFYYKIVSGKKTPIKVAILAYCSWGIGVTCQFNIFLYNPLLWSVFGLIFSTYLFGMVLKVCRLATRKTV